jgi:hypothetical protein
MSLIEEVRSVRERVEQRLRELEPLVREYNELKQIAAELGLPDTESGATSRTGARSRSRTRDGRAGRTASRSARSTAAPRSDAGDLASRVVEAVRADPGKTVAEYAAMLDVAPGTLYRPVRELTTGGVLVKRARQLFPS